MDTQKSTLGPTGLYELVLVAVKTSNVQHKCQGPLQLLSPPFLMTSTTKQMRPNGRGGGKVTLVNLQDTLKRNLRYDIRPGNEVGQFLQSWSRHGAAGVMTFVPMH